MSGFLAVTGGFNPTRLESALNALAALGGDESMAWSEEGTAVAVTRKSWELGDDFSGRMLVLERPDLVIACDAAIYDRAGLVRALAGAGVTPQGSTGTHLIEAAYRAWGPALVEHLNGEFAFVVWDRRKQCLLAARDPVGMRGIYYARTETGIALATSSRTLAQFVGRADELNLASLATQVAGLMWALGSNSVYRGVDPVPAGHRLVWENGRIQVDRFWHPPLAPDHPPRDFRESALELQSLIGLATTERMGAGVTTVWMSGGWDSTAVFGAGQHALAPADRVRLRPVSISYPTGDPGREDDLITSIAERWNADVAWLQSADIPLLEGLEDRAALADEPPAHLYELWNRALAQRTRSVGARIALDGCGGDNLFQGSDIALSDMLRTGRWVAFARRALSRKRAGWRYVARNSVLPLLPDVVLRVCEAIAGRRLPHHYREKPLTAWIRPDFVAKYELRERDLAVLNGAPGASQAQKENILCVVAPISGWAGTYMRGVLLQEGLEVRSPLLDLRIIDFALRQPIEGRADGIETKKLLRQSMHGLLPDAVLAPRKYRTGVTTGFSDRRMREGYPELFKRLFAEPLRLAELGIIDPVPLRAATDAWQAENDTSSGTDLFNVMKVEFWLRARDRAPRSSGSGARFRETEVVPSAA